MEKLQIIKEAPAIKTAQTVKAAPTVEKKKLTLLCRQDKIKTLKVKAVQYEVSVSELVEIFATMAEKDKKQFTDILKKYRDQK